MPLYRKGEAEPYRWACGSCGQMHGREDNARHCYYCAPSECRTCGDLVERGSYCRPCSQARSEKRERERFEAATKLTWEEYGDDPVVVEGDHYYVGGMDELLDCLFGEDLPVYVWACKKVTPTIEPGELLRSELERWEPPDEMDFSFEYERLLLDFFKKWNAKQTGYWWIEDDSRAVLVPQDVPA